PDAGSGTEMGTNSMPLTVVPVGAVYSVVVAPRLMLWFQPAESASFNTLFTAFAPFPVVTYRSSPPSRSRADARPNPPTVVVALPWASQVLPTGSYENFRIEPTVADEFVVIYSSSYSEPCVPEETK